MGVDVVEGFAGEGSVCARWCEGVEFEGVCAGGVAYGGAGGDGGF